MARIGLGRSFDFVLGATVVGARLPFLFIIFAFQWNRPIGATWVEQKNPRLAGNRGFFEIVLFVIP
jgi:hypothetical protein